MQEMREGRVHSTFQTTTKIIAIIFRTICVFSVIQWILYAKINIPEFQPVLTMVSLFVIFTYH